MNISIITTAFNGYGRFIPEFIESICDQEVKEIVIVLGIDHGLKQEIPKKINGTKIKIIYYLNKAEEGFLKNIAVENTTSKWILSVDVDDILLPNAIKEIKKTSRNADFIALKYIEGRKIKETPIPEVEKLMEWRKYYCDRSGYAAFRKSFVEKGLIYKDSKYSAFPFYFNALYLGARFKLTNKPCTRYRKREDGEGKTKSKENRYLAYTIINNAAIEYYSKIKGGKVVKKIVGKKITIERKPYLDFNKYEKYMFDIVYVVDTRKPSPLLPLSIKTAEKNLRYRRLFIAGNVPEEISAIQIPIKDKRIDPLENIIIKLKAIIEDKRVSQDFILMNDDFFILKPYETIPYYHKGLLKDQKTNQYWEEKLNYLLDRFPDGKMFSIHAPIILNKEKLKELFEKEDVKELRSWYCNYYNIKGEQTEDYKAYENDEVEKYINSPFLSITGNVDISKITEILINKEIISDSSLKKIHNSISEKPIQKRSYYANQRMSFDGKVYNAGEIIITSAPIEGMRPC